MESILKIKLIAIISLFALNSFAQKMEINFDRGIDMGEIFKDINYDNNAQRINFVSVENSFTATRDCHFFNFYYNSPVPSPVFTLKSYVYRKVCQSYQGQNYCHDELVRTVKRNIKVSFSGERNILPWERDIFNVCLKDTKIDTTIVEATHKYKIMGKGGPEDDYEVIAEAVKKVKTDPDSSGIYINYWGLSDNNSLRLELKDKWAEIYSKRDNEKTIIKVVLKMKKDYWFDPVIFEKEFIFKPSQIYNIDFSKYKNEFKNQLVYGQKYYVEWGFIREGEISRNIFVDGGKTEFIFLPLP